jgi:hypothetical protein
MNTISEDEFRDFRAEDISGTTMEAAPGREDIQSSVLPCRQGSHASGYFRHG